jgi:rubrerythrin
MNMATKLTGAAQRAYRNAPPEEVGPWRCVVCGTAVRRGKNDPCKCFPQTDAEARAERRSGDRIDGYDRDDLGESPDY